MRRPLQRKIQSTVLAVLMALAIVLPGHAADQWAGIDGSIDNVNQLMATAKASVDSGDIAAAKINLAYTAKNLEQSASWAHSIWMERQSNPGYNPITLNDLPAELTVGYYADKIAGISVKYKEMIVKLKEAKEARARQQLKIWLQLLFNMVSLGKEIKDSITGNPLLLPKNLYEMQENAQKNAEFIQKNFDKLEQAGTLVKHLEDLMAETVAIYYEFRRVQADVETLIPEVKRIETAMAVARESIKQGMNRALPPAQLSEFNNNLQATKTELDKADLAWESGLVMINDLLTKAQAVYDALPVKTQQDTDTLNSYKTFKTNLTTARETRIEELTTLGNAWRTTLISILNQYLAISLGNPVALADCSGRNSVDASLALDDMERRAWKSEYAALLSAPTGPPIVPARDGSGADEWHEYTAQYPARLMERLDTYSRAWQSASASMSYADWQALFTTTDTRQPYQVFVLKRGSLNVLLENLNALRSEANRYYGAFGNAVDAVKALESDLNALQSRADAYRQFLVDNAGTVPTPEFDEYFKVTDTDLPGLSARLTFAAEGISVLETETFIDHLTRVMTEFDADVDEMREQATKIGNQADVIAFEINRMLLFNDALAAKRAAATEMLDYKFDSTKDVFLGNGDYGYLFDSLEILDNAIWRHVDTRNYHPDPPDIETQIVPHVNYIQSLGTPALNRFVWLTEQIWSVTDNLAFANPEIRPNPSTWGTGYGSLLGNLSGISHDAGKMLILAENKALVDEFTQVRFLKYHNRPYTDPMGYITLDEIRKGLPRTKAWVAAQTGGGYTGLAIERIAPATYTLPINRKSQLPFTIRVVDGAGQPVAGVPVTLDYNAATLHGETVVNTDAQGLAAFFPGPYNAAGEQMVNFSVVYNPGGEIGPSVVAVLNTTVTITADTDGDGCPDAWETLYGFDPAQDFDGAGDFDGDGLTNAREAALGTDPNNADSDGDGYSDGIEVAAGSDPRDPTDTPRPPAPEAPPMLLGKHWQKMADDIGGTRLTANDYYFSQMVSFKGHIWAFGQHSFRDDDNIGRYVNDIWRSPDGMRWIKVPVTPPWAPRHAFTVTVHNNRLYLVGGNLNDRMNAPYPHIYFADVWVSDDGLTWSRVTERAAFGPRRSARVHSLGDRLYLIGGYASDDLNQRYGDQQDVWSSTDGKVWTRVLETAPWPKRKAGSFGSAVFNGQLWVIGGDGSEYDPEQQKTVYQVFRDVWRSADGAVWTKVTDAPVWRARYGADLVAYDNRLWLFGGYDYTDSWSDPTLALPFEVWSSGNGADWLKVDAPAHIKGTAFATDAGLWSLAQPQNDTGVTRHTLWHSRGTGGGDATKPLPVMANPTTFSAGADHALAVKSDGTLWAWGGNHAGQLGSGATENSNRPIRIGTDSNWKAVAAGWFFSLGLKADGTLWAWGQNYYGQLGDGANADRTAPVRIGQDTDWAIIAAGQAHALAVKTNGTLWAWGLNNGGQLGDGTKTVGMVNNNKNTPVQIGTDTDWLQVAAGSTHSAALKGDGSVWTWGSNYYSQLGTSFGESLTPAREEGSIAAWTPLKSGILAVSTGSTFTTALRSDGRLYAWGNNTYGQIGIGYSNSNPYITQINPFDAWAAASAGSNFTAAIQWDNRLWGWGNTNTGEMGDGTFIAANTPQPIGEDRDWIAVASGATFFIAQKADGSLWAWGDPGNGALGNGTFWRSQTPTRVLPLGATEADTDGDGMDDAWERTHFDDLSRDGTDDFDRDGLTDFQEWHLKTDPTKTDTEGDGIPDKWEFEMGLDPLVDDSRGDQDRDGLSNLDEYRIVRHRSVTDGVGNVQAFAVSGQTLYVIDSEGNLKAYDTANPAAPALLGTFAGNFGKADSGGVFGVKAKGAVATVADGNGNFQLIDVSNPAQMTKAGEYPLGGYIQGFDVSDTLICAAYNQGYLVVIDISDPKNPKLRETYTNDTMGGLGKVFISGNRVYATRGGDAVQIIDIADPDVPVKIGQYEAGDLVWPPALAFSGTRMAAAVRPWEEGPSLKFIDTAVATALTEIGRYRGYVAGVAWAGNLGIAATENDALDVLDLRNPAKPRRMADINNIFYNHRLEMVLSGGLLFVPYNAGEAGIGIAIIDVSRFLRPLVGGSPGDLDHSETVDLADAVLALQILAGRTPGEPYYTDADVNGDGRIDLVEALFILQKAAGLR
jgi:alpha-tubulin suppressor-like RCC1 family protein